VVALEHVGLEPLIQLTTDAGLGTLATNPNLDLAITLGGGEVRLLDLVQAYSSFANGGHRVEPVYLLRVETRAGDVLHEWQPAPLTTQIIDERLAWLISDMLSDDEARLRAFGRNSALNIGRPAAAKTGTTTDYRDNWIVGYTPNLVGGVWVGNADNTPMVDVTGLTGAGPIWNAFMREVLLGQPEIGFERPPGLTRIEVCALSGLLPSRDCPRRRLEWFIDGTEPRGVDNIYQRFTLDRRTGALADDDTPPEDRVERVFAVLPQEARDWAIRNNLPQPPTGAPVQVPDANVGVRLLEPDPYTIFEISPLLPISAQRVRLTVGTPPETASVTYLLNGEPLGTVEAAPWALWWTLELGAHELIAEATLTDGSAQVSTPIPFAVAAHELPQTRTETRAQP
ncbi:MAG: hypothetical protein GYB67_01295, partial [Chloroflexi bacterium]|nr:hypothetical protein [Chloroflexota bacterium]